MAVAAELAFAVKPATVAPVTGLIEAILRLATPLTVLNLPATKSLVPSGDASISCTALSKVGRNEVSISPVVRLNAATHRWLTVVVLFVALLRSEVKVPTT